MEMEGIVPQANQHAKHRLRRRDENYSEVSNGVPKTIAFFNRLDSGTVASNPSQFSTPRVARTQNNRVPPHLYLKDIDWDSTWSEETPSTVSTILGSVESCLTLSTPPSPSLLSYKNCVQRKSPGKLQSPYLTEQDVSYYDDSSVSLPSSIVNAEDYFSVACLLDSPSRPVTEPRTNCWNSVCIPSTISATSYETFSVTTPSASLLDSVSLLSLEASALGAEDGMEAAEFSETVSHSHIISFPSKLDVLSGRGPLKAKLLGNTKFRELCLTYKRKYGMAKKFKKEDIAREVLAEVEAWGGRFLKEEHDRWALLEPNEALKKIKQTLRDLKSQIRKRKK